jgi:opacity protein-like surface antigen
VRCSHLLAAIACAAMLANTAAAQTSPGPPGRPPDNSDAAADAGAFFKTLGSAVLLQPGLVDVTETLQRLLTQVRLQYPGVALPEIAALPSGGASVAPTARIWGRKLFKDRVEVSAAWQVDAAIASDPALIGTAGFGGSVPVAGSQSTNRRRLVDFDRVLVDRDNVLLQQNIDRLAVKLKLPRGELVVGRQVLSWGAGRFWNPTDLLSPFAPTDIDREVRHGVDAIRYSVPLSATSLVDLLYLPQKDGWAQGGVARVQANTHGFDLSGSAAKYGTDLVVGADGSGDLGPLGVHAEIAYTHNLPNLDPGSTDDGAQFVRGVAGVDWRPAEDWTVTAEYHVNGFGAAHPAGYADKLRSPRVVRGEVFGAGRHYLGVSAAWQRTELLSLQALLVANAADPSALVIPVAEYWATQKTILRIGGDVPIGARPDPSGVQRLTPADVITTSPAYRAATQSLGLRSEYGASAWGVFAQLSVYF